MNDCKELVLDVMAITAVPVSDIDASGNDSVANMLTPTIDKTGFSPKLEHAVTIGREKLSIAELGGGSSVSVQPSSNTSCYLVPIVRTTGKAKDDESDSVAGRLHTVTVNCEVDHRGGEIWGGVEDRGGTPCSLLLEREPHHLILSLRDGTLAFVAATADAYQCTVERDGSKVSVAFKIYNLMGIQVIT